MKRILSLLVVVLLCAAGVGACVKAKSAETNGGAKGKEVVVLVMDSTQALLDGAKVKIGKTELTTSFDGRVVVPAALVAKDRTVMVRCEGYKDQTLSLKDDGFVIVTLESKPGKKPKADIYDSYGVTRSSKGGAVYRTTMLAAESDGALVEEAVFDVAAPSASYSGKKTANNVSAGKLTAGEVNDFAKWYFWPRVLDGSHQKYINEWRLQARHRYTVQVTNGGGYPIVSRAVSLLDGQGNTLYQAVTDNTGKAELWYQFVGASQCGKHAGLFVHVDDQIVPAKEWSEGLNTGVLDEPCEVTDAVDVMFVFDATGSMGDELRYLQAEMKDVIARATDATGGLNIRTGAVVYRDHGDEYITRLSRLTSKIKTTQSFIDKQSANGGGDYPEAVPEALMAALNSAGWDESARARIAFLILDAPCHQDSATIALLHEQILNAAALGVRLVPVVCSGIGESGELLLRSMALATNGTSFFLTDDSGIGNPHLKPTTDSLKVEHLNDMLVRTSVEFSTVPNCEGKWDVGSEENENDAFIPNPFEIKDLTEEEKVAKNSRTTLYLLDISGKLIYVYEGSLEDAGDSQLSRLKLMLSTGVYFVKAFYDGEWHTKKILVH